MQELLKSHAMWYCYKDGENAIFLNRWDEVIKRFDTYKEAEDFGNKNIHLIDKKIDNTTALL